MRIRVAITILAAILLSSCSGDGDSSFDETELRDRLATAQQILDEAERIDFTLATDALPSGVTGLLSASGFGNQDPAFSGDVTVVTGGASIDAEVIAVDGELYAKTGFAPVFLTMDPATLGAPNPADLIGTPGEGVATILSEIDISDSDRSRDGSDVLTSISGTLDGAVVARYLPSADADGTFTVTVRLTDDDELRDAVITGSFYPGAPTTTYTLTLDASDQPAEITAPSSLGGS